ncbi:MULTISPECIES: DoxX family protein [Streptomyces]|uniref:DoxX family protein n=1 Tax=Streptomyces lycopersici TaxID=2974589 RepID=UPI0021D09B64|nr:DoxX family protein [Streptomyces sp. NEAU-383]
MFVGYVIAAVLVTVMLVFSGRGLIVKDERVMASLSAVQVSDSWRLPLAAVKFAGALGLAAGIVFRPLGIVAAVGVVLFFLGAVGAHLRVKDGKGAAFPVALVVVSAAPLLFGLASV